MSVALVGGMDRLSSHYVDEADRLGIRLTVFNVSRPGMAEKIRNVDALVVFTNKISHESRGQALRAARARNIPVVLRHSCGICTFRNCLDCLKKQLGGIGND
ncbi:MAG: DUF2325 domain-containing protein [Deltaproteobacteria bacterium]|nr:DUF2325 domain-containing protein [Deltaproteobacteria bacterium]